MSAVAEATWEWVAWSTVAVDDRVKHDGEVFTVESIRTVEYVRCSYVRVELLPARESTRRTNRWGTYPISTMASNEVSVQR